MEEWRSFLYPLGFLSALAFATRFIIQWIESEKVQKSLVSPLFWKISLFGNLILTLHSFIQIQYHVCIIQTCNAVIAWRNLDLMQQKREPRSLNNTLVILIASMTLISLAFALQEPSGDWFRIPTPPWQKRQIIPISIFWHIIGSIGYFMFSSRFWIQWILAEKFHKNNQEEKSLPLTFWWLSLGGAALSIAYFLCIGDTVNLVGPALGFIPYFRNLVLIYKMRQVQ